MSGGFSRVLLVGSEYRRVDEDVQEAGRRSSCTARCALFTASATCSTVLASEIAFLLGFDEPNSFYRAFKASTGVTPDRARTQPGGPQGIVVGLADELR